MIKGKVEISFDNGSSYVDFENNDLKSYEIENALVPNNETPNFGIRRQDGNIEIIDYNNVIKQKIYSNNIQNKLLSNEYLNATKVGRSIGKDLSYNSNENIFRFSIDNLFETFSNVQCESFTLYDIVPSGKKSGVAVFKELVLKTIDLTDLVGSDFVNIDQSPTIPLYTHLMEFEFNNQYFECKTLADMWQQFLNATMCNMFINGQGKIDLDPYFAVVGHSKVPIVITKEKREQNVNANLINNNQISLAQASYRNNNGSEENNICNVGIVSYRSPMFSGEYNDTRPRYKSYMSSWLLDVYNNATTFPYTPKGIDGLKVIHYYKYGDRDDIDFEQDIVVEFDLDIPQEYITNISSVKIINTYYRLKIATGHDRELDEDYVSELSSSSYAEYVSSFPQSLSNYTENKLYISQQETNGIHKARIRYKPSYLLQISSNAWTIYSYGLNIVVNCKAIEKATYSYGSFEQTKSQLILQDSSLFTSNNYLVLGQEKTPLYQYIVNKIISQFSNGKQCIEFTTSNYVFYYSNGNLAYDGNLGQLLTIGDIVSLPDFSNKYYKITNCKYEYKGYLKVYVKAIEYSL